MGISVCLTNGTWTWICTIILYKSDIYNLQDKEMDMSLTKWPIVGGVYFESWSFYRMNETVIAERRPSKLSIIKRLRV